jgi:hypothetical protein
MWRRVRSLGGSGGGSSSSWGSGGGSSSSGWGGSGWGGGGHEADGEVVSQGVPVGGEDVEDVACPLHLRRA